MAGEACTRVLIGRLKKCTGKETKKKQNCTGNYASCVVLLECNICTTKKITRYLATSATLKVSQANVQNWCHGTGVMSSCFTSL